MFENLSASLGNVLSSLGGKKYLTEENIQHVLREIRLSLLEADVALPVIKTFIEQVKGKTLGKELLPNLNVKQTFIKIVHDELVQILGPEHAPLNLKTNPPAIILIVGLQGAGKTTTAAKLARYLKETANKKVMLASLDVYRPAAILQLKMLAEQIGVEFFAADIAELPADIAKNALANAKKQYMDVIILDTAGRLHIDDQMMLEIGVLQKILEPIETLFVVDSMSGQDAINTAKVFHDTLSLTGVILTKTDGDARGGVALSVKQITGQPIKFLGVGEKIDALELFYPARIASRILGMGDLLSLIEEIDKKVDKQASEKLIRKIAKGKGFDLEDFREQLLQMNKMGGIMNMVSKLPGLNRLPNKISNQINDQAMLKTITIINSMTLKERSFPKLIIGSRKKRIALGSGSQIHEVNQLLKQFERMQKLMKKFNKPGDLKRMMHNLGSIT